MAGCRCINIDLLVTVLVCVCSVTRAKGGGAEESWAMVFCASARALADGIYFIVVGEASCQLRMRFSSVFVATLIS